MLYGWMYGWVKYLYGFLARQPDDNWFPHGASLSNFHYHYGSRVSINQIDDVIHITWCMIHVIIIRPTIFKFSKSFINQPPLDSHTTNYWSMEGWNGRMNGWMVQNGRIWMLLKSPGRGTFFWNEQVYHRPWKYFI